MEPANQKCGDTFLQYGIIASFAAAVLIGLLTWSLKRMVVVYVVGVFITMVIVVPDWEFFTKRHFTEWIEPMPADDESRKLQKARFRVLKRTSKYAKREDIHPLGIAFFIGATAACSYYLWKFVTS